MKIHAILFSFLLLISTCLSKADASFDSTFLRELPTAYKGRFRPMDAYARLWLYDLSHSEQIESEDLSALELIWTLHFFGHTPWDNTPLFWISDKQLKTILGITQNRLSYRELTYFIEEDSASNLRLMQPLLHYHFLKNYRHAGNRSKSKRLELSELSPGLWAALQGEQIVVTATPKQSPWHHLKQGFVIGNAAEAHENQFKHTAEAIQQLVSVSKQFGVLGSTIDDDYKITLEKLRAENHTPVEMAQQLENQYPLFQRLLRSDILLKVLPSKQGNGEWLPLKALKAVIYNPATDQLEPVSNFTLYPDEVFASLRNTYLALEKAVLEKRNFSAELREFANALKEGYARIAETQYKEANGKALYYPSLAQLKAESIYYRFPFILLSVLAYAIATVVLLFNKKRMNMLGVIVLGFGLTIHTSALALRCYILGRPPVSNMFETIVYVPWVAVLLGLVLFAFFKQRLTLIASSLIALILLLILQAANLNNGLENPQAVLDSQYWLIIHVLLVVGSYGAFLLSGILGHFYLGGLALKQSETPTLSFLAKCILQTMYIGVAMLIPGTILGGVWAAESWGRFWDWDPKEAWAFISICNYLIWIHAYRFHRIHHFGLAVGAVIGLAVISFTWYGVNYILGTGLHSYGFGAGGEGYYYLFLLVEMLFLVWTSLKIGQFKKA